MIPNQNFKYILTILYMCVLHVIIICTPNRQLIPFILTDIVLPVGRSTSVNIKTIANFSQFCT